MTEETSSLILGYMKRFANQLNDFDRKLDRTLDDMRDMKFRLTNVEEGLAGVNRRLDRIEIRIDRIEKRLDLVDHL